MFTSKFQLGLAQSGTDTFVLPWQQHLSVEQEGGTSLYDRILAPIATYLSVTPSLPCITYIVWADKYLYVPKLEWIDVSVCVRIIEFEAKQPNNW
jgi:hypothetical protein